MAREWRTRTFKSGNSVAVRLPKATGIAEGEDIVLIAHRDGSLSFWRKANAKAVFMSLYGSMSPGWMAAGRGDVEQDGYAWDDRSSAAA